MAENEHYIGRFGAFILRCVRAGTISDDDARAVIEEGHREGRLKKAWEEKTPEEQEDWRQSIIAANSSEEKRLKNSRAKEKWWKNLTPEEKDLLLNNMSKGQQEWWDSATEEEKKAQKTYYGNPGAASETMKIWWHGLNKKERKEFLKRRGEAISAGKKAGKNL